MAVILRFIQGIGDAFYQTAGYAIITIEFSEDPDKYLGYAQAAVGVGLFLGPSVGSIIYSQTSYEWTFFIFGIIILLTNLPIYFFLSKDLNKVVEDSDKKSESEDE